MTAARGSLARSVSVERETHMGTPHVESHLAWCPPIQNIGPSAGESLGWKPRPYSQRQTQLPMVQNPQSRHWSW